MKQFLELTDDERIKKVREAVAAVEGVDVETVFCRSLGYSISPSEGVRPDVNVKIAFTRGRLLEGEYTMRWDAEKERFVKLFVMARKLKAYVVRDSHSVFDPIRQQVNDGYIDFAIAHVMRELGFRGETSCYFVKAKGEKPKLFQSLLDDHNGYRRFFPHMGGPRSLLQPYDKEGYICSAPSDRQIADFCKRMGTTADTITDDGSAFIISLDKQKALRNLIRVYRQRSGFTDAFRRYLHGE